LCATRDGVTSALCATRHTLTSRLGIVDYRVGVAAGRTSIVALVVFAAALSSVDALRRSQVTNWLQETALADLAANEVVDTILKGVDLLNPRELGLVEGI